MTATSHEGEWQRSHERLDAAGVPAGMPLDVRVQTLVDHARALEPAAATMTPTTAAQRERVREFADHLRVPVPGDPCPVCGDQQVLVAQQVADRGASVHVPCPACVDRRPVWRP